VAGWKREKEMSKEVAAYTQQEDLFQGGSHPILTARETVPRRAEPLHNSPKGGPHHILNQKVRSKRAALQTSKRK
jgi:hypothetical protein